MGQRMTHYPSLGFQLFERHPARLAEQEVLLDRSQLFGRNFISRVVFQLVKGDMVHGRFDVITRVAVHRLDR